MRCVTDEKEIKEIERYMNIAAEASLKSECRKSKRGVILVNNGMILSDGYNTPLLPELCCARENIHDNRAIDLCSALHAEEMAILNAAKCTCMIQGARLYHIQTKNGEIKPSGNPSCTQCSKSIYGAGIAEVVLLHEKGYAIYDSKEFNELSFKYFLEK